MPLHHWSHVLFQASCIRSTKWDDPLDEDQAIDWRQWFSEFPSLRSITASRCFTDNSDSPLHLHTFVDTSSVAYAAVTYARQERPDGSAKVTLAVAKARPAPIRRKTILMLELQAAVLGSRLSCAVGNALGVPVAQQHHWSDSMNVLHWIKSPGRKFKVDVGNRISEIQELTDSQNWHHVSTRFNPADLPSHGTSGDQLAHDQTWWSGPEFLAQPASSWPEKSIVLPPELPGQLKKQTALVADARQATDHIHPDHFSSWSHLVQVTAWCYRFINNTRCRTEQSKDTLEVASKSVSLPSGLLVTVLELQLHEIHQAKLVWIGLAQQDAYGATLSDLKAGKELPVSLPLQKLRPILDTSGVKPVMKVNGRLRTAHHLPPGLHSPMILPKSHRVTALIINDVHDEAGHCVGTNHLLSNLAEEYWIVQGKTAMKAHRHPTSRVRNIMRKQPHRLWLPSQTSVHHRLCNHLPRWG